MSVDRNVAQAMIELGQMALALGRVDRVTFHEDGVTPESDTDHTVMLGLIAPAFAARFLPELDRGKIAQYALVHDLVEVYAGDTPTLRITPREVRQKHIREERALARIIYQFGYAFPWLTQTLLDYEAKQDPESRFVWAMDKILPKITHLLNGGTTLAKDGITALELDARLARQFKELSRRLDGQMDPVLDLYVIMKEKLFEHVYGEEVRT